MRSRFTRALLQLLGSTFCGLSAVSQAATAPACEMAGQAAERAYGLPDGLLVAIGRVESGRWDDKAGRVIAWPWVIDVEGEGRFFDDADQAIRSVRRALANGRRSVDVGCFQINLAWHPNAFVSLDQAFDPTANANYAASFLASIYARLGSWPDSVAAYHSSTPDLARAYRDRVMALWKQPAQSVVTNPQIEMFGMHIWTPGMVGTNPPAIAETRGERVDWAAESGLQSLPAVIVPRR